MLYELRGGYNHLHSILNLGLARFAIQPQSIKFATGVENEAAGVSKLNDSPGQRYQFSIGLQFKGI